MLAGPAVRALGAMFGNSREDSSAEPAVSASGPSPPVTELRKADVRGSELESGILSAEFTVAGGSRKLDCPS
jgi:hypothetical protein